MDGYRFPIWNNLSGWSNFYHFFHLICYKQDSFPVIKRMIEQWIANIWFIKLSMYAILIRLASNSFFSKIAGEILYQLTLLEFIGFNFITLFSFAFAIIFTIYLLYYYHHRDNLMLHHAATPICFILQDISPLFVNYVSGCTMHYIEEFILGERPILLFILAVITFIIFNIYTFLGALFHHSRSKRDSVCHSFWKHIDFFKINLSINLIQQLWAIRVIYSKGIFPCMGISFLCSLVMLGWVAGIPYYTKTSNAYACEVFGVSATYLVIEIAYFSKWINFYIFTFLLFFLYPLWNSVLSHAVFETYLALYERSFKKNFNEFQDLDNFIYLPSISTRKLKNLLHYALMIKHEDLHSLLIAAIDSDRSDELTIECTKMLMISSSIPHRIREKLYNISFSNLSLSSKHFLCEIQYEINKLRPLTEEINDYCTFLRDQKQKSNISLYAFINSLCDTHYKDYQYQLSLNFAMSVHDFKLMAEYSYNSNILSQEIAELYQDYLDKVAGDICMSDIIKKRAAQSKNILIMTTNDKAPIKIDDTEEKIDLNEIAETSRKISMQKSIDLTPNFPLIIFVLVGMALLVDLFLPALTMNSYVASIEFNPTQYFDYHNSPPFFKAYYLDATLEAYMRSFESTLGNQSIFAATEWIGFHALMQYLNKAICPTDGEFILNSTSSDSLDLKIKFYNLFSQVHIFLESDPHAWVTLHNTYDSMNNLFNLFDPIAQRYINCSDAVKINLRTNNILNNFYLTISLLILFAIVVIFLPKRYIMQMIHIFSGIEVSTLEEFRAALFLQAHSNKMIKYRSSEINQDGALDLEEIEADEGQFAYDHSDYSDLLEQSVTAPLHLSIFDPSRGITVFVYTLIIFIVKYAAALVCIYHYSLNVTSVVEKNLQTEKSINAASTLLLNLNGVMDSLISNQNEVPSKINISDISHSKLIEILNKYNNFIGEYSSKNESEKIEFVKEIESEISSLLLGDFMKKSEYNVIFIGETAECIYWIVIFILTLSLTLIYSRFYIFLRESVLNIKRLVIVLHSKVSPTESIMINSLTPGSKDKNEEIDMENFSQVIISQLRLPVIFFDSEFIITGFNQMLAAQLGYSVFEANGMNLEKIIPVDKNEDFYDYINLMFGPYGVKAIHTFNLTCHSKENSFIEFATYLIPIEKSDRLLFGLLMRNLTEIKIMKDELQALSKKLQVLLHRIMPRPVANLILSSKAPNIFVCDNCAVLAVALKHQTNIGAKDLKFDATDISEIAISIMDQELTKYPNIHRIRTFNGVFLFVSGFFTKISPNEAIQDLLNFSNNAAANINKSLEFHSFFTGVINYGGPVFGFMSGITKTLFDMLSKMLIDTFDYIDIAPPGKLVVYKDAYKHLDNKQAFIKYTPHNRNTDREFYIMHSYLGMQFESD